MPVTPESSSAQPVMPTSPVTVLPAIGVSKEPNGGAEGTPGLGVAKPQSEYVSVVPPYVTDNVGAPGVTLTTTLPATTSCPATGAAPFPTQVQYVFTPAS